MKRLLFYIILLVFSGVSAQERFSVYFDSNKFEPTAKEKLRLSQWISENGTSKIVAINGYTDEDGTSGFNDTLAKKRVDFIFNLIKDRVKIRDDFKSRSFGENHELSKSKAENRKVVIYFITEKDLPQEDEILGIKREVPQSAPAPKPEVHYPEKMIVQNPDGTKSEFRLNVAFMKKVGESRPGEKLEIKDLNFNINTFVVTMDSREKLYELLMIMQKNPNLKIDIQGHLCCNLVDKQDLSTKRAKAVCGFLVANGIDKSRLSYQGFGSTKAIYPLPEKNDMERGANRRVEIEIVANP